MRGSIHWPWPLQYVFSLPSRPDVQCPHFLFSACHKLAPVRYGYFLVSSSANHGPDLIFLPPPSDSSCLLNLELIQWGRVGVWLPRFDLH